MKTASTERKSVKTLKGQLFGAVAMMLVACIALGTSTYAWFINNRTVEVENMQLTVSTSTSLLVAVGKKASIAAPTEAANWTGYKSVVINEDITGVKGTAAAAGDVADWNMGTGNLTKNLLSLPMVPASVSNRGLITPVTAIGAGPTFFATDNHVAKSLLDQFDAVTVGSDEVTVGMGPVKRIPLRFSASSDMDVFFGKEKLNGIADMISPVIVAGMPKNPDEPDGAKWAAADKEVTDSKAQADAIKAAIRVAVVPKMDTANYTGTVVPLIFQFDTGALSAATNANNTDYQYLATVGNIYNDPANDTAATGDLTTILAGIQAPTVGKYAAVKTADTTSKHITDVAVQQTIVPGAADDDKSTLDNKYEAEYYWATVDPTQPEPVTKPQNGTPIFTLLADKPREVDVYIWLEGTDEDCLNALSGYTYNLNLPFASTLTVPPAP